MNLMKWLSSTDYYYLGSLLLCFSPDQQQRENKYLSFTQIQEQIRSQVEESQVGDIGFDPHLYRAPKDVRKTKYCSYRAFNNVRNEILLHGDH